MFFFFFLFRDGEESCRKQLGRVLSIWQERAVYDNSLLDQLSQVLCKFAQCAGTRVCWLDCCAAKWKKHLFQCVCVCFFSFNVFTSIDGEKKAKKRQYEEIQPDVEDFASQSSPAEPPQVLPHTHTSIFQAVLNYLGFLQEIWPQLQCE